MGSRTLVDELRARVLELGDRTALRARRRGRWTDTTWRDWLERSRRVAAALGEHGLAAGDRVAIAATTRLEWAIVDLGIWMAGGISACLHPSSMPAHVHGVLADAQARFLVTDSADHAHRLLGDGPWPTVIGLGPRRAGAGETAASAGRPEPVLCLAELEERGRQLLARAAVSAELRRRSAAVGPAQVATVIYRSGTAGEPCGVALTHQNLLFEADAVGRTLALSPEDEQLLFLPLTHVFGRMLVLVPLATGTVTSFAEGLGRVLDNMAEVRPSVIASVPRLFEKVYALSHHAVEYDGPLRQRLVRWAEQVGDAVARAELEGRRVGPTTALAHRYADRLVLSQVRERFGGRLRLAISGGAPLDAELGRWFYAAGVPILEVYGLTECTGGATINRPERFAFGSVGEPLPGVEVRLGTDGEVLIRGDNVMHGYWRRPEQTARAIDGQGFLHTGDLGELRRMPTAALAGPPGWSEMVCITGRSKELLVTSGGSNVAPRPIEQLLEQSPWIQRAVVLGDRRPCLVALLALDQAALNRWAAERGLDGMDGEALALHPDVRGLLETDVQLCNQRLPRHERIRRFGVLPRPLSARRGELTEADRVDRPVVARRYASLLESLYGARRSV